MSSKFLIPALLVTLLAGCASTTVAATDDPVRARVVADLEQARKDGSYPPSEADYVTPNWVKIANPAGVIMTDGHLAEADTPAVATAANRGIAAAPAAAPMTDGHPELETARTIKGGDSAN